MDANAPAAPWYDPGDAEDIARALPYALSFALRLSTSWPTWTCGPAPLVLQAAESPGECLSDAVMEAMVGSRDTQPIFEDLAMIN